MTRRNDDAQGARVSTARGVDEFMRQLMRAARYGDLTHHAWSIERHAPGDGWARYIVTRDGFKVVTCKGREAMRLWLDGFEAMAVASMSCRTCSELCAAVREAEVVLRSPSYVLRNDMTPKDATMQPLLRQLRRAIEARERRLS